MRKIITKHDRERLRQRNQLLIGGVMIVLMVLSTLGYAISVKDGNNKNDITKKEYNGIQFLKESEYWQFTYSGSNYVTRYNPIETENITINGLIFLVNYQNKPLYITGDRAEAFIELNTNLLQTVERIQPACEENNCSENLPIKNCSTDNIIIYRDITNSSKEGIKMDNRCIIITADYPERSRYTDKIIFKILGI